MRISTRFDLRRELRCVQSEKRWRTGALQDAGVRADASREREASWSAPVLWRFCINASRDLFGPVFMAPSERANRPQLETAPAPYHFQQRWKRTSVSLQNSFQRRVASLSHHTADRHTSGFHFLLH